jgi:lipid-binding SYLF domain-containing protein
MTTRAWFPLLAVLVLLSGCMSPQGDTAQDKRQAAQKMRSDTLAELYELEPQAREQIGKAVGYGVFSNVGIYLVVLSAGNGYGVVEDNETGAVHHMKMATGGLGLGLGVKDFRGVFVFTSREALDRFVESGWDASAQADAAAKSEEKGDAWAITKNGLALQATIQGTKYWKDDELS